MSSSRAVGTFGKQRMRAYRGNPRKRKARSARNRAAPLTTCRKKGRFFASGKRLFTLAKQSGYRRRGAQGVWGAIMLGLLSLMGLFAAGIMVDAVTGMSNDQADDDPADIEESEPQQPEADSTDVALAESSLLPDGHLATDDTGPASFRLNPTSDDGMPQSDDSPDTPGAQLDLVGGGGNDVLNGGGADDALRGLAGRDMLAGGAGDDRLFGDAGADILDGGDGNDSLRGGDDDDWLRGGAGDDLLWGNSGDDTVDGWAGDDTLAGGLGADSLNGGEGADVLRGGDGGDRVVGGLGDDGLYGGAGNDEIDGGDGNDLLAAGEGVDVLNGGAGDDTLWAGSGTMLSGGSGADDFMLGTGGSSLVTDFDSAADRLVVVYDPVLHPSPAITVEDAGNDALIRLDGIEIASISGGAGLTVQEVELRSA
ncbi:hypothetical protein HYN69_16280 [Gemmobacter aquarius]|uniref:Hemolysin-type calcium-binding repeat-containing protein n=2 Tax=Paragemmobacter aquarius TaxID=2169400 RepID=A0A2S0UPX4_9RHOB|nr:hypothetical protein HYN69_16280 [Gemmobacter aquarius]